MTTRVYVQLRVRYLCNKIVSNHDHWVMQCVVAIYVCSIPIAHPTWPIVSATFPCSIQLLSKLTPKSHLRLPLYRNDVTSDWIITWLINIQVVAVFRQSPVAKPATIRQQSRTYRRQSTLSQICIVAGIDFCRKSLRHSTLSPVCTGLNIVSKQKRNTCPRKQYLTAVSTRRGSRLGNYNQ